MKLGFIGTGAIAEAVISGLIEVGNWTGPILCSRRSESRSRQLQQRFETISVVDDNQAIVDRSDIVFVSVLPDQARTLLSDLDFQSDQVIASFVAMLSVGEIENIAGPVASVHRLIPMPSNEFGVGPVPIFPPSPELQDLFSNIGTVLPVEDESLFSVFSGATSLMAFFFEFLAASARWIEHQGCDRTTAARFSTSLYQALATYANSLPPGSLGGLSRECITAGGLNEQVLNAATDRGWFDIIPEQLELILERINKPAP